MTACETHWSEIFCCRGLSPCQKDFEAAGIWSTRRKAKHKKRDARFRVARSETDYNFIVAPQREGPVLSASALERDLYGTHAAPESTIFEWRERHFECSWLSCSEQCWHRYREFSADRKKLVKAYWYNNFVRQRFAQWYWGATTATRRHCSGRGETGDPAANRMLTSFPVKLRFSATTFILHEKFNVAYAAARWVGKSC